MKFQYIGAGIDPPERCTAYGHKFVRKGKYIDITDEAAIAKLEANPSFTSKAQKAAKKTAKKAPAKKKAVTAKKGK